MSYKFLTTKTNLIPPIINMITKYLLPNKEHVRHNKEQLHIIIIGSNDLPYGSHTHLNKFSFKTKIQFADLFITVKKIKKIIELKLLMNVEFYKRFLKFAPANIEIVFKMLLKNYDTNPLIKLYLHTNGIDRTRLGLNVSTNITNMYDIYYVVYRNHKLNHKKKTIWNPIQD